MDTRTLCQCKTLKGTDCTRYAVKDKKYCRQHENAGCSKHTPFKIMICKAIISEASRKGSSRQYIKKYLECNYNILPQNPHINKTIKSMIEKGELIPDKYHKGHYRVSLELKKTIK